MIKNVLAASVGAMIVYSVYMGECDWRENDCWSSRTRVHVFASVCVCVYVRDHRTAADAADPPLRHDIPRGEVQQPRTGGHRPQDLDGHQRYAGRQSAVHSYPYQVATHRHSHTHP